MAKKCEFCQALKFDKSIENFWRVDGQEKFLYEYTVALVSKRWLKSRGKRHAGRTTDYRNQGLGYKLNYCPECGRPIKEVIKEVNNETMLTE